MVAVSYHTDPACPWSWALEPVVRKLMIVFGEELRWRFVMGGLAREFGAPGSRTPLDPGTRAELVDDWLRVAAQTGAPLDPLVWSDGALASSYPACMAVEAAAEQAPDGGYRYLRRLREGIMCERRKLDHAEALVEQGREAGLDVERLRVDLGSHAITEAFAADLERTQELASEAAAAGNGAAPQASHGAGGAPLPSMVLTGDGGERHAVLGYRPFEAYRDAAASAGASPSGSAPPSVEALVERFGRVTTAEVEVVCELPGPRAGAELFRLAEAWRLRPVWRLTGYLWERA